MTLDELRCDCNCMFTPSDITDYIFKKAYSAHQYVAWLKVCSDGDIVVRTWAFRKRKDKPVEYTEVERKSLYQNWAVRRNIYLTSMSGYRPVYSPKTVKNSSRYGYNTYWSLKEEFNKWYSEKPMNVYAPIINQDDLFKDDKYKYCGFNGTCYQLFKYLTLYNKYPETEFLGKAGIEASPQYIKKVKKDKGFAKWLYKHRYEANSHGVTATLYAYNHNMDVRAAKRFLDLKREAHSRTNNMNGFKEYEDMAMKISEYMDQAGVGVYPYRDYWNACVYLGLDMRDTKNAFPKDFRRMHDLRTEERASKRAKEDAAAKRNMSKKFKKVSEKYRAFEIANENYKVIIPQNPKQLVHEGSVLHHCVGRMGYDAKMASEKCLIGFIRKIGDEDTPFVTVEFVMDGNRISQCYADHDSRPPQDVIDFAEEWGKQIKDARKKAVV